MVRLNVALVGRNRLEKWMRPLVIDSVNLLMLLFRS